jgi:heme-degrading monooxygenase HmoA
MVRVLIERWLKPGKGPELLDALRGMRGDAVHAKGYISGETLHDAADPDHFVTVSTWHSREEWNVWADCKARQDVRERVAHLLAKDERVTVLEHS